MRKKVLLITAIAFCWSAVAHGTDKLPVTSQTDVVIEPQPLLAEATGDHTPAKTAQRNPFSEVIVPEKIPDNLYLTKAEQCQLRGIIKLKGQQMVLLQLPTDQYEEGGKGGSAEKLRRYALGDRIMIIDGSQEFHFTLKALDNRSAVLQGENDEEYTLWL